MKAKKNQNLFALILDKMGSWSLLILIGVVMAFANSKFLTSSNIINVLRQIAVVTIGAVGVSFVILAST
jgi:ribose transport system permease protein